MRGVPSRYLSLGALLLLFGSLGVLGFIPLADAADPATERFLGSTGILKLGDAGGAVADLQTALVAVGEDPGPIDGDFGSRTDAAVRAFQSKAGIPADGVVGQRTRAAIAAAVPPPEVTTTTVGDVDDPALAEGARGDAVVDLQRELSRAGYYRGPLDGDFGPATAAAVVAVHKTWGTERIGAWASSDWSRIAGWYPESPGYGSAESRIEVDLGRQVLFVIEDGSVVAVMPVSSGSGEYYTSLAGAWVQARTPRGNFAFFRNVNGWDRSYLGNLYEPWYFLGGYALHGSQSVPPYPASHGCIRLTIADAEWLDARLWLGMPIHVRD